MALPHTLLLSTFIYVQLVHTVLHYLNCAGCLFHTEMRKKTIKSWNRTNRCCITNCMTETAWLQLRNTAFQEKNKEENSIKRGGLGDFHLAAIATECKYLSITWYHREGGLMFRMTGTAIRDNFSLYTSNDLLHCYYKKDNSIKWIWQASVALQSEELVPLVCLTWWTVSVTN